MQLAIKETSFLLGNSEFAIAVPESAQVVGCFPSQIIGYANIAFIFNPEDQSLRPRSFVVVMTDMTFSMQEDHSCKLVSAFTAADGKHYFLFELVALPTASFIPSEAEQ